MKDTAEAAFLDGDFVEDFRIPGQCALSRLCVAAINPS
jgi:hypothetical protein